MNEGQYRKNSHETHAESRGSLNNSGLTLIELITVVSIIGILGLTLALSFQNWMGTYNVESQIKELHMELMSTRARAMQRNRMHFTDLFPAQYAVYEDTDPAPNGNGIANPAADTRMVLRTLDPRYPITWSNLADMRIEFDIKGLSIDTKTICSNTDVEADYNCISVTPTRINLGQLTTLIADGGACNAANCVEK